MGRQSEELPGMPKLETRLMPVVDWWAAISDADLDGFLPKWSEYGSNDLAQFGQFLADMAKWDGLTHDQLTELGCFGYMLGKMARAAEAYTGHRFPSDDTLHDLTVYSMMARRTRDGGL